MELMLCKDTSVQRAMEHKARNKMDVQGKSKATKQRQNSRLNQWGNPFRRCSSVGDFTENIKQCSESSLGLATLPCVLVQQTLASPEERVEYPWIEFSTLTI